jgi:hypothetical protein
MNRQLPPPASHREEHLSSPCDKETKILQEHPAIVHGSDLIVWGAPENCVRSGDGTDLTVVVVVVVVVVVAVAAQRSKNPSGSRGNLRPVFCGR